MQIDTTMDTATIRAHGRVKMLVPDDISDIASIYGLSTCNENSSFHFPLNDSKILRKETKGIKRSEKGEK